MVRRLSAFMKLLPFAALAASTPAMSAGKPDFSTVTTRDQAEALVREGRLVRILLFPAELGGDDRPENSSYVTPEAAEALQLVTGTIRRFAGEGLIDKLDVAPEYHGDSFVPARIVMHGTSSGKPDGGFHPTIEVW